MRLLFRLLISVSVLIFTSCETTERIDDFPLRPSKLVLNSFFTGDSTWAFQISKSLSVLDNAEIKYVNNAVIELYRDGDMIQTIDTTDADGWYRYDHDLPETGVEYTVKATAPGFGSVLSASSYLPEIVEITGVTAIFDTLRGQQENVWYHGLAEVNMNIAFSDPPQMNNYYQLNVYTIDTSYYHEGDSIIKNTHYGSRDLTSTDPGVANSEEHNRSLLFHDEYFDGKDHILKVEFNEYDYQPEKMYKLRLISLTEDAFNYFRSINEYRRSREDPFAEPVEIYCNVENGFGVFSGMSVYETFYPMNEK